MNASTAEFLKFSLLCSQIKSQTTYSSSNTEARIFLKNIVYKQDSASITQSFDGCGDFDINFNVEPAKNIHVRDDLTKSQMDITEKDNEIHAHTYNFCLSNSTTPETNSIDCVYVIWKLGMS